MYTGGCFKDSSPVHYIDASPGETRNFKDVQFEVRPDQRSFDDIASQFREGANEDNDETYTLVEDEPEQAPTEGGNTTKPTEDPNVAIKRERDKLYTQAANGEVKPEGFYFFYKLFMFFGGLALFLAIVCFIWLIYIVT